jgi:hypothetical protein
MRYTVTFSNTQSAMLLGGLLLLFIIVFCLIPAVRRSVERGKKRLISFRAIVSFGPKYIQAGAIFYRVTVYEDFLVLVFLGCTKIRYADIQNVVMKRTGIPTLKMRAHGVPVSILGDEHKLEKLYRRLTHKSR